MEVSYRYWDIIKNQPRGDARAIVKDFVENGNTRNSMPWAENIFSPEGIDTTNNIYSIFDELVNTVNSFANLTSMQIGFSTEKVSKSVSVIGLGIALTQLGMDLYNSNGNDRTAAANLYKNIFSSSGSLFTYMTGYGSLPFSAAFVGVAVVAFGLDYGVQAAGEYKEATNRAIFDQYYRDYAIFDEQYWYKLFVETYWKEWQNGTASVEGIEAAYKTVLDAIEGYSEEFWKDVFREGSDALTFAVAEAGKTNYYTPTEEQKATYTEALRRDMHIRLRKNVLPWIEKFLLAQQQDALYASLYKLCEPFNEFYSIQVQEIAPIDSGDPCKYQEHTIRFGNESGFTLIDIPGTWTLHAPQDDDEWAVKGEFTYLAYLLAGAPDRIMLFPKGSDAIYPEDAVLTQTFTVTEKVTVIPLGSAGLSIDEIVGTYDGTVSSDDGSASHTFTIQRNGDGIILNDTMDTLDMRYDPSTGIASGSKSSPYGEYTLRYTYRFAFTRDNGTISLTGTSSAYLDDEYQATASFSCYKMN